MRSHAPVQRQKRSKMNSFQTYLKSPSSQGSWRKNRPPFWNWADKIKRTMILWRTMMRKRTNNAIKFQAFSSTNRKQQGAIFHRERTVINHTCTFNQLNRFQKRKFATSPGSASHMEQKKRRKFWSYLLQKEWSKEEEFRQTKSDMLGTKKLIEGW